MWGGSALCACVGFFLTLSVFTPALNSAETAKQIYILYEKGSRFQEITLDGIQSRLAHTKPLVLGDEGDLKNCDGGDVTAVIAIGRPSLDKSLESCKSTPVIFSLVSAPQFGSYRKHRNVTGVSFASFWRSSRKL